MLNYHLHGTGEGPVVCFLHGFMGTSAAWSEVIEGLSDEVRCLTVDLPGHGDSLDRPARAYSIDGAAEALVDVLDEADVDRCTFVGYSMGGRVALYFGLHFPERVDRLVLESASPGLSTEEERRERRALDAERADAIREDFAAFLEDWYRQPLFRSLQQHDLVDELIRRRQRNDPDELARVLEGMGPGSQSSLWEALDDLEGPVLVLTGEEDPKYGEITAGVHRRVNRSQRIVVSGAGHNVHAERPRAFVAHLSSFLGDK